MFNSNKIIRSLEVIGVITLIPIILIALRLVFEQTILTLIAWPQMVGFSLIHTSSLPTIAFTAFCIRVVISIFIFIRIILRYWNSKLIYLEFGVFILSLALIFIPEYWRRVSMLNLWLVNQEMACEFYWSAESISYISRLEDKCWKPFNYIYSAAASSNFELLEYWISKWYSVNDLKEWAYAPLQIASDNGHIEMVKKLISLWAVCNDKLLENAKENARKDKKIEIISIFENCITNK